MFYNSLNIKIIINVFVGDYKGPGGQGEHQFVFLMKCFINNHQTFNYHPLFQFPDTVWNSLKIYPRYDEEEDEVWQQYIQDNIPVNDFSNETLFGLMHDTPVLVEKEWITSAKKDITSDDSSDFNKDDADLSFSYSSGEDLSNVLFNVNPSPSLDGLIDDLSYSGDGPTSIIAECKNNNSNSNNNNSNWNNNNNNSNWNNNNNNPNRNNNNNNSNWNNNNNNSNWNNNNNNPNRNNNNNNPNSNNNNNNPNSNNNNNSNHPVDHPCKIKEYLLEHSRKK